MPSRRFSAALWSPAGKGMTFCVMFNCVYVTFPCRILGQVWCLIVSIPDLCRLSYFHNGYQLVVFYNLSYDVASESEIMPRIIALKSINHYRDHTCVSCINICWFPGSCLNKRPIGRVFQHLTGDPASVNARKQTCEIVILTYFTLLQQNLP